jgi:hypothetical protein
LAASKAFSTSAFLTLGLRMLCAISVSFVMARNYLGSVQWLVVNVNDLPA